MHCLVVTHATGWLAWIAHHLGSEGDFARWHIPTWIPHWQLRLGVGLAFGLTPKAPTVERSQSPAPREG